MVHPRVALASGFAALAGAVLILVGSIDAPVPLVLALVLAARAAAPAASEDGARTLARLASSVPAWTGVVSAGVLRAGSVSLADARGANAVAGLALVRGSVLIVAACVFAVLAALVATLPMSISREHREFDLAAIGVQIVLIVSLFAGPQIRRATDVVPWILGVALPVAAMRRARDVARWDWVPKMGTALAAIAVALALAAPKL